MNKCSKEADYEWNVQSWRFNLNSVKIWVWHQVKIYVFISVDLLKWWICNFSPTKFECFFFFSFKKKKKPNHFHQKIVETMRPKYRTVFSIYFQRSTPKRLFSFCQIRKHINCDISFFLFVTYQQVIVNANTHET